MPKRLHLEAVEYDSIALPERGRMAQRRVEGGALMPRA
jgi:hypothetical protein